MQIHVARPPAQLGVFSLEEVVEGLRSGRFLPTDQGWRDGMPAWTPLGQWSEFAGFAVPLAPPASASPSAGPTPAWERGSSFSHFFGTFKEVALAPVQTFDNLSAEGSFTRPLSFNYFAAAPGFLALFCLYAVILSFMGNEALRELAGAPEPFRFLTGLTAGGVIALLGGMLCCLFLLAPLGLFITAAFSHLLLLPWGPKGGYAGSFRASAYVNGVFFPLTCIPCVNYVALPWQMVVNVIALACVHKIEWWKVLLSVIVVPCVVCCGLYAVFFATLLRAGKGF